MMKTAYFTATPNPLFQTDLPSGFRLQTSDFGPQSSLQRKLQTLLLMYVFQSVF